MCLHHLLLDTHKPHTIDSYLKMLLFGYFVIALNASIYPAVISSRWRLREWFQHWLVNTFTKNTMHTPHFQHGTCILQSSPHYAMPPSWYSLLWHTAIPTQTSMPPPNVPFWQSESDQDPDSSSDSSPDSSSDEEEDFQTVPIDDEHWTTEMVPERTFCIHEDGLPNNVCQYPCPCGNNNNNSVSYMDSLELSDISDYEDYMMTTSNDEELPGLEEVPYWTLVCLNTYLTLKLQYVTLNFIHNRLNIDWDIYWNTNLPFLISCIHAHFHLRIISAISLSLLSFLLSLLFFCILLILILYIPVWFVIEAYWNTKT